ncbi:hypothetical protein OOJ91_16410 [Micromonospora lupini]|uniref:hypothetical protein n=1 Tax=Micromonospora lupini TaxID=285679 RepID=UPI00225278A6|nr:hypothetical protein [Micromonospora lupini]MCX5067427.1 hypothetical protein [Micromonospora lupini]
MARPLASIAVLLAVSASLTACGGDTSGSAKKVEPSAATVTPAAQTTGTNTPTFRFPPDLTVDIQGFESKDATESSVLRDASYAIQAILEAEAGDQTVETPNFKRYWTGPHGAEYADMIIGRIKSGKSITGTYRYYSATVKPGQGGARIVDYCEDQREAYDKDAKTGKAAVTTPSLSDFRSWSLVLRKGAVGDWQVTTYNWVKGAKSCRVA